MKILSTPEFVIHHLCIRHNVPQLAIELVNVKDADRLEMGEIIKFTADYGYITAEVFNPGDRVVLKRFEYYKDLELEQLTILQKIVKCLFNIVGISVSRTAIMNENEVTAFIINRLNQLGDGVVIAAKGLRSLP